MSDRELPKLRGMGDRLIADVAKPSHAADKIFCLIVPIDGVNCCFSKVSNPPTRCDSFLIYGGG